MIRLSCWIKGVSCVPVDKVLVEDTDQAQSPVMQTTPVKRCIDADIDVGNRLGLHPFANVSSRLLRHFHSLDREEDGESSLDEIREAWRRCRDKLMARREHDWPDASGKTRKEVKAPCLTDTN